MQSLQSPEKKNKKYKRSTSNNNSNNYNKIKQIIQPTNSTIEKNFPNLDVKFMNAISKTMINVVSIKLDSNKRQDYTKQTAQNVYRGNIVFFSRKSA